MSNSFKLTLAFMFLIYLFLIVVVAGLARDNRTQHQLNTRDSLMMQACILEHPDYEGLHTCVSEAVETRRRELIGK